MYVNYFKCEVSFNMMQNNIEMHYADQRNI